MWLLTYNFNGKKPSSSFYRSFRETRLRSGILVFNSFSAALAAYFEIMGMKGEAHIFQAREVEPVPDLLSLWEERKQKRGRKGRKKRWVVTCFECVRTFPVVSPDVSRCPFCGGFLVRARFGFPVEAIVDKRATDFEKWVTSRFVRGKFEIPAEVIEGEGIPFPQISPGEMEIVEEMKGIEVNGDLSLLDRLFCSRLLERILKLPSEFLWSLGKV